MRAILPILLSALACGVVQAQSFTEVDSVDLATIDPATNNGRLGRNVALAGDGNTVLVAAPFKEDANDGGSQDGSVYALRVRRDGTLDFLQAIEPVARYQFGTTLAADGIWAAIGEANDTIHLYRETVGGWTPAQILSLDDVPATPGITLRNLRSASALSGDLLALGDTSANLVVNSAPVSNGGAVVLFRRGGDSIWRHEATLIAPTPDSSSGFGGALALSGDTLLVGAPEDSIGTDNVGGAYVFQRSGGTWSHVRTLRNPDAGQTSRFGWSVALEGDLAIVGCATCLTLPNPEDPSNTGSFFAHERNLGGSGNWGLRGEFASSAPGYIDNFSIALRLRDDTLLVGASGSKQAVFFTRAGNGQWHEVARLVSAEAGLARTTNFGIGVDFVGGRALIGADAWPDTSTSARWGELTSWLNPSVEACGGSFDGIFCDGYESFD